MSARPAPGHLCSYTHAPTHVLGTSDATEPRAGLLSVSSHPSPPPIGPSGQRTVFRQLLGVAFSSGEGKIGAPQPCVVQASCSRFS